MHANARADADADCARARGLRARTRAARAHAGCARVRLAPTRTRAWWRCPRGEAEEAVKSQHDAHWEPKWQPFFTVLGESGELVHDDVQHYAVVDPRSDAVWIQSKIRMSLAVTEHYDLHLFPFDVQDLNLRLICDNGSSRPTADRRKFVHS